MKTRSTIAVNVLFSLAIALCASIRDANAQSTRDANAEMILMCAPSTCVGLRNMDGRTVWVLPTGSVTLYPYATGGCNCNDPLPNYTIDLSVYGIDYTGGHNHGHYPAGQPSGYTNPSSCTTDVN